MRAIGGGGKLRRAMAVLATAGITGGAAAVGASSSGPTASAGGAVHAVNIKLVEFKLIPSRKSVPPGAVTFVVRNAGKINHQFVVLKTNQRSTKLTLKGTVAVETGRVGKIALIKPGQTKRLTLHLKPGHYVLLCNLPGHYKAGQRMDFVVLGTAGTSTGGSATGGGTGTSLPPLVARGKTLYEKGPGGGVPYGCAHCHGLSARGDIGPKIVGKDVAAIDQALGTVQMMQAFTNMTGDQIKAIAAYLRYLAGQK